jgi:hypothetical protein
MGRAVCAGGLTALLFHWLPPLPIYVGAPACVVVFTLCALALGLVSRADVELFRTLIRRKASPPAIVEGGSPAA